MFHKQVAYFNSKYRVITYDHRGQGQSQVTETGYDMDNLYEDTVQLIEQLNLGPVHFAGLSMGGFIGIRLAARRPDLIKSLTLMETSAQAEPNKLKYRFLTTIVKLFGIGAVVNPVMNIMFGDTFLQDDARQAEKRAFANELKNNKKTITRAVNGVINRRSVETDLPDIKCATLIMVGTQDKATTPEKAEFIHMSIPQSKLVYIKNAGHTASIEEPEQVNAALEDFLLSLV